MGGIDRAVSLRALCHNQPPQPPRMSLSDRRLLYVAMTRAKDDLHLLVPQRFFVHGQASKGDRPLYASRTRFITEALLPNFDHLASGLSDSVFYVRSGSSNGHPGAYAAHVALRGPAGDTPCCSRTRCCGTRAKSAVQLISFSVIPYRSWGRPLGVNADFRQFVAMDQTGFAYGN